MEQWVPMRDAAKQLGVSTSKLSRLAKRGVIKTHTDVLDQRVKLVDLTEVKTLLATSRLQQYRSVDHV